MPVPFYNSRHISKIFLVSEQHHSYYVPICMCYFTAHLMKSITKIVRMWTKQYGWYRVFQMMSQCKQTEPQRDKLCYVWIVITILNYIVWASVSAYKREIVISLRSQQICVMSFRNALYISIWITLMAPYMAHSTLGGKLTSIVHHKTGSCIIFV